MIYKYSTIRFIVVLKIVVMTLQFSSNRFKFMADNTSFMIDFYSGGKLIYIITIVKN